MRSHPLRGPPESTTRVRPRALSLSGTHSLTLWTVIQRKFLGTLNFKSHHPEESVRRPPSLGDSDWIGGYPRFLESTTSQCSEGRGSRDRQPASGAWPASTPSASTWLPLPSFFTLSRKAFQVSGMLFSRSQPSLSHSGSSGLATPSSAVCK